MAENTIIAWTDHTFSIAWGCMKVSPGCKHCYADVLSSRYGKGHIWGPPQTTARRTLGDTHWSQPHKWNRQAKAEGRRHRVFSSSMCDNFEDHPTITQERARLWALIEQTPWLDWQILTKRADRLAANLPANWDRIKWHVWLGVSIENDEFVWRADHLRTVDPVVRFISYEPALGPVPSLNLAGIHWLIVGGESGGGHRPMDHAWARDIRDRCGHGPKRANQKAPTAFFFKQSSAARTEMGTALIEADGSRWAWKQYPGELVAPVQVTP